MKKSNRCDLSTCFLCQRCLPEWKPAIQANRRDLQFRKNESMFKEGDPVRGIYFVTSGIVKIHKQWGTEKEVILRFAREGEIVGHRGIGPDSLNTRSTTTMESVYPRSTTMESVYPRSTTMESVHPRSTTIETLYPISATATQPVTACFIDLGFFQASLKVNQEFMYGLLLFFAGELQESERKMRDLAHMPVKGRLASALLSLQEKFGRTADGQLGITVSRQDLSSYVGATYETVFRMINELSEEGLIATEGKDIRILDRDRLHHYSKLSHHHSKL